MKVGRFSLRCSFSPFPEYHKCDTIIRTFTPCSQQDVSDSARTSLFSRSREKFRKHFKFLSSCPRDSGMRLHDLILAKRSVPYYTKSQSVEGGGQAHCIDRRGRLPGGGPDHPPVQRPRNASAHPLRYGPPHRTRIGRDAGVR